MSDSKIAKLLKEGVSARHIEGIESFDDSEVVQWLVSYYEDQNSELLEALQELFADYKQLADSGDAGFWSLEDTEVGKKSMAAIAKALGK